MQSFLAMVLANLKMTVRNRQAIFWNLAFPAIFILLFGAIFGGGGTNAFSVGVAGGESPLREQVTSATTAMRAGRTGRSRGRRCAGCCWT